MAGPASPGRETEQILEDAGVPWEEVASYEPVDGGTYNTLFRITTTDGRRLILKLAPDADIPSLAYERGLLKGEVAYFRAAGELHGLPVPSVLHSRLGEPGSRDFLLMSECRGTAWNTHAATMTLGERIRLRRSLGELLARTHSVAGPGFGYPAESVAPLCRDWRSAFTAMLEGVLADAGRYAARLPVPVPYVRAVSRAAAPALEKVEVPALVHFDLWEGNILLDGPPGTREISGIVDGERMFWGDPLAELPSLHILGAAEDDPHLMAGYHGGGTDRPLDDAARIRVQLYRCYLYLIMLVETVPRKASAEDTGWLHAHVGPALKDALETVDHLTRSRK